MFLKFSKAHWLKLCRDRLPDERKREMQFTRWLRNRAVTVSEMTAHAATGTAERVSGPLLKARKAIEQQTNDLDGKVLKLARYDAQVRRFMTVPGVGPITALCFTATIDDPTRFKRSRSVGAYVGLTADWTGRISKCGDAMLRSYLFEAAGVLLTRVPKWSALKAWGMRLAKRNGLRKATVAVARKLAVIMHRMWIDGTEFNWSKKEVAA
jgi:transposase